MRYRKLRESLSSGNECRKECRANDSSVAKTNECRSSTRRQTGSEAEGARRQGGKAARRGRGGKADEARRQIEAEEDGEGDC